MSNHTAEVEFEDEITVEVSANEIVVKGPNGREPRGSRKDDPFKIEIIVTLQRLLSRDSDLEGVFRNREDFKLLGKLLFDTLFGEPSNARDYFFEVLQKATLPGQLRVLLQFRSDANDLAKLPWEYIFCESSAGNGFFVCTRSQIILSRFIPPELSIRQPLASGQTVVNLLIVVCTPRDLGEALEERTIETIERLVESNPDVSIRLSVITGAPAPLTPTVFLKYLQDFRPDILHFIGHGQMVTVDDVTKGQIALQKSSGSLWWYDDEEFAGLFVQAAVQPRLVFLQFCEGGRVDFEAKFAGVASQLIIKAGVQVVVAMQHRISNRAAIDFSREFYQKLFSTGRVDVAVQEGRSAFNLSEKFSTSRVFGTPVIYLRSKDAEIFPRTLHKADRSDRDEKRYQHEAPVPTEEVKQDKPARITEIIANGTDQDITSIKENLHTLGNNRAIVNATDQNIASVKEGLHTAGYNKAMAQKDFGAQELEQMLNSVSKVLEENNLDDIEREIKHYARNAPKKQLGVWTTLLTTLNEMRG